MPSRENLHLFERTYLKKSRTWVTADVVLLIGPAGEKYVMKDFSGRPAGIRQTWCRFMAAREIEAYRLLQPVDGVPHVIAVLGPECFVMQHMDGQPLPRRKIGRKILSADYFAKLDALIRAMHEAGVAHGDLRRRNVLVSETGEPRLIDFETAWTRGESPLRHRLFDAIARIDRITVLKIKDRYFPGTLTPDEQREHDAVPWHLRVGRFLRQYVYGLLTAKGIRRLVSPTKRRKRKRRKLRQQSHR